ncbi:MAG: hypothetical protein M3R13_03165 [Armatimonadota bacterium]|nr:hypothetical protein [Armatimonadota bacterium]
MSAGKLDRWSAIPLQMRLLLAMLVALGLGAILLGWDAMPVAEDFVESEYFLPDSPDYFPAAFMFVAGFAAFISAWLVINRSRVAPAIIIPLFVLALARIIESVPASIRIESYYNVVDQDESWAVVEAVLAPGIRWLYFAIALALVWLVWRLMFVGHAGREWFRLGQSSAPNSRINEGKAKPWRIAVLILFCALTWLVIGHVGPGNLASFMIDDESAWGLLSWPLFKIDLFLPFAAACAILLASLYETLIIDERGIRITLSGPGWTMFGTTWNRVSRIDIVRHNKKPSSAVIRRKWLLGLPLAFTAHSKRYENGETHIDRIVDEAEQRNIPVKHWYVSDNAPLLALALIAWGVMIGIYSYYLQTQSWIEFLPHGYPLDNFAQIADPVKYGAITVASACCFGAAFGVLSAFHQASPRPVLLAIWVVLASVAFPNSIIHWLVWMAVFHILIARRFLAPDDVVATPTMAEWNLGMTMDGYAVIFSAIAYLIALMLVCRRIRPDPLTLETQQEAGR